MISTYTVFFHGLDYLFQIKEVLYLTKPKQVIDSFT